MLIHERRKIDEEEKKRLRRMGEEEFGRAGEGDKPNRIQGPRRTRTPGFSDRVT
jgi:hypothetical protein